MTCVAPCLGRRLEMWVTEALVGGVLWVVFAFIFVSGLPGLFVCLFDMLVFPGRIMMCEPELGWLYPAVVYVNWCFDYRIKIGYFNKLVLGFVCASHILVVLVRWLSPKWTVIDDDFKSYFCSNPSMPFIL